MAAKYFLLLAMCSMLLMACVQEQSPSSSTSTDKDVIISTFDGWALPATHLSNNATSIILLHQLGSDRSEWEFFARRLHDIGYNVLTLDLRGHGASAFRGQTKEWKTFTERDFNLMRRDLEAAHQFLAADNVTVIGASIGANIAVQYAADASGIGGLILLSPGESYREVSTVSAFPRLRQPILVIASSEDSYAAQSSQKLTRNVPNARLQILNHAGHGTAMMDDTDLDLDMLTWLSINFPPEFPKANQTAEFGLI